MSRSVWLAAGLFCAAACSSSTAPGAAAPSTAVSVPVAPGVVAGGALGSGTSAAGSPASSVAPLVGLDDAVNVVCAQPMPQLTGSSRDPQAAPGQLRALADSARRGADALGSVDDQGAVKPAVDALRGAAESFERAAGAWETAGDGNVEAASAEMQGGVLMRRARVTLQGLGAARCTS